MTEVVFDAETHIYRAEDGRIIPSVTQILRAVGASVDYEALSASSRALAEAVLAKRRLGIAVHEACCAYDSAPPDGVMQSPTSDVSPYLEAWIACRHAHSLTPIVREHQVVAPDMSYCGRLDGVFFRETDGQHILIDIKLSDPTDAAAQYQTAAYERAYRSDRPAVRIGHRWAVQLRPDLSVPYQIYSYIDWKDYQVWDAFVTTYYHQAARRR